MKATVIQKNRKVILPYILLSIFSLPILLMYLWLILSSFTSETRFGVIPVGFTVDNWRFLWGEVQLNQQILPSIWQSTWNSLIFSIGLTLLEVTISLSAAYALSRMSFPGRKWILSSMMLLHAFPAVALLIAVYYVLSLLGLIDSIWGVLLLKTALQIPMSIYIMKGFFDEVSWDVEWSSLTDGCNRFTAWYQVVLPLVKPGIAAISIFSFLSAWSEFLLLYMFIYNSDYSLLSTYIKQLMGSADVIHYGVLSAVSLFYMIPVLCFFFFTQNSLMQMNMGGGKQA
ncbi:carbohydrate ABC transporter permease [Paenibacillus polysaccharolyticus]|uniref:carbohydrate ABC transporter permease n=1 Tax=Paenibacillus polysaccharolyticus TaxID=582692 RepID=UPI00209E2E48|nr:carbohydrate ABC transporter permease [Paenibacillus polysaccharolyticus]MCP1136204.1 carbohydrate ABC transporter permease [Paenibacillus polysaccharolyticus]